MQFKNSRAINKNIYYYLPFNFWFTQITLYVYIGIVVVGSKVFYTPGKLYTVILSIYARTFQFICMMLRMILVAEKSNKSDELWHVWLHVLLSSSFFLMGLFVSHISCNSILCQKTIRIFFMWFFFAFVHVSCHNLRARVAYSLRLKWTKNTFPVQNRDIAIKCFASLYTSMRFGRVWNITWTWFYLQPT